MRTSEWIQSGFALLFAVAAWFRPLPLRRRWMTTILAALALVTITLVRHFAHDNDILRDWLPVPLLLIPYWQTGQFFLRPNERFQAWLIETDRRLLKPFVTVSLSKVFSLVMEYAYLSCYPLVPAGLGALYATGHRAAADTFWFIVLIPTYLCYAITPFFPALPPRSLSTQPTIVPKATHGRSLNLEILKYGSIHAISFPSAHVASSLAVALVLLHYSPIAGSIFLVIAIAIGIAAVAGGYHYAIDVLLGAVPPLCIYIAWLSIPIPLR